VEAAASRIQALNPLVKINTLSDDTVIRDEGKLRAMALDTFVTTSGSKEDFVSLFTL
jgi:molybdopterin/thiamine biosynthesis adenylyltransferase